MRTLLVLTLFWLAEFLAAPVLAQSIPVISFADIDSIEISNQTEIFLDHSGTLTLDQVTAPSFTGFQRNTKLFPSFGTFAGRAWLRFAVSNPKAEPLDAMIMLEAPVLDARMYYVEHDGLLREMRGGRVHTGGTETFANRMPTFPIAIPAGEARMYYISITCDMVYTVKLSLNTKVALFQSERVSHYFAGFYLGVIVIMICYNFFLFLSTRDRTFLWYVLTVLGLHWGVISLMSSNGEYFGYRWAILPTHWAMICKFLGTAAFIQFSRMFLHTGTSPRLDLFFRINLAATPIFLLMLLFLPLAVANAIENISLMGSIIVCIVHSGILFSRGVRYARYYFIAWFPFLLVGSMTIVLNVSGMAHLFPNLSLLLTVGAMMEVLLLSMALGDKLNELKAEKELADQEHKNTILAMNRSLEQKVKEKTRDIQSMLDNLKLGIFTVNHDLRVGDDYSRHLSTLVDGHVLASRDASLLLFADTQVGPDIKAQVETAICSSIGSDDLGFEGNEHLFLHELRKNKDGRPVDLEVDWSPIQNEDGSVEKILVAIKDVTLLNTLKREGEEQRSKLDRLAQFLGAGRRETADLEANLLAIQHQVSAAAQAKPNADTETIDSLFRALHTNKAESRRLKLVPLSDAIHEAEDYLQAVRKGQAAFTYVRLNEFMATIQAVIQSYHQAVASLGLEAGDHASGGAESLELLIMRLLSERHSLAADLHKPVPILQLDIDASIPASAEHTTLLKTILLHLLRNSLDHGLEAADERARRGKALNGTITVRLRTQAERYVLEYSDDGGGLNLDRIYQKAQQQGLVQGQAALDDNAVAQLILAPNFSTSDSVSDISGRGVGMDAVVSFMQERGGHIHMNLGQREGEGRYGRRPVVFRLEWPRTAAEDRVPKGRHAA